MTDAPTPDVPEEEEGDALALAEHTLATFMGGFSAAMARFAGQVSRELGFNIGARAFTLYAPEDAAVLAAEHGSVLDAMKAMVPDAPRPELLGPHD
jgi:hypothetical protein